VIASTGLLFTAFQASAAAGYKLTDAGRQGIADFRDDIVDVKKEVDATLASLDKIVAQATVDPRKAFKEFDKGVPASSPPPPTPGKQATDMRRRETTISRSGKKSLPASTIPTSANWLRSARSNCRPRSPRSRLRWSRFATSSAPG
jgi:hypothetical protein